MTTVNSALYGSSVTLNSLGKRLFTSLENGDLVKAAECLQHNDLIEAKDTRGCTPLIIAAEKGYDSLVHLLLKIGANPNARCLDGSTALHYAVQYGKIDSVQHLIASKAGVNAQDSGGATPLAVACQLDRQEIAELLVETCDVNLPMMGNTTPLIFSVMRAKYWWVNFLLEHGADHSCKTDKGMTAASYACLYFHSSIAWLLHKHGADFWQRDEHERNLIMLTMTYNKRGRFSMILFLLHLGIRCDLPDKEGSTPLLLACQDGDYELVDVLLKYGAKPMATRDGDTPLGRAVKAEHYGMVKKFLSLPHTAQQLNDALITACSKGLRRIAETLADAGADTLYENHNGLTPLIAACVHEQTIIIGWLVSGKKVPVNLVNKKGLTALNYACFKERLRLIKFLKEMGADINFNSPEHGTSLAIACNQGAVQVATALLDAQVLVNLKGPYGMTPMMLCCLNNRKALLKLLIDREANLNMVNDHRQTALILACEVGSFECAQLLLAHGADLSLRTNEGFTALHYAASHGHSLLVDLLIKWGASVEEQAPRNTSPLLLACEAGRLKVVQTLRKHRATHSSANLDGITPLICARVNGHNAIVRYLQEWGAAYPQEILFSFVPLFLAPKTERDEQIYASACDYCREANAARMCPACDKARYCDVTCENAHKELHFKECHSLSTEKNGYAKQ